jgi:hypothetical protein
VTQDQRDVRGQVAALLLVPPLAVLVLFGLPRLLGWWLS